MRDAAWIARRRPDCFLLHLLLAYAASASSIRLVLSAFILFVNRACPRYTLAIPKQRSSLVNGAAFFVNADAQLLRRIRDVPWLSAVRRLVARRGVPVVKWRRRRSRPLSGASGVVSARFLGCPLISPSVFRPAYAILDKIETVARVNILFIVFLFSFLFFSACSTKVGVESTAAF